MARDDRGVSSCAYCGSDLGPFEAWRDSEAIVLRVTPVADVFDTLAMRVRDRTEAPRVTLSERFCGACGGALHVETLVEGWSVDAPIDWMTEGSIEGFEADSEEIPVGTPGGGTT
jgi:hypothetical protein